MATSTPMRGRTPVTTLKFYAMYGKRIADGDISVRSLEDVDGISERRARTIAEHVKTKGPPPDSWRVVVIGDAHFCPHHGGIGRAETIGRFITQQAREAMDVGEKFTVVCIGDWADYASLSSYEKGKKEFEGRAIRADIHFSNEASLLLTNSIAPDAWAYMARPPLITLGNHTAARMSRLLSDVRELEGVFGIGLEGEDAEVRPNWTDLGWEVFPFLVPAFIDDVAFLHFLPNPSNGRAVSSVSMGRALILKGLQSVVVGHNHLFKFDKLTRLDGTKVCACSVGCAFEHDHDWAGQIPNAAYDRGITVLNNLRGSDFNPRFYTFEEIRRVL